MKNIVLIGIMGCGKTSCGNYLTSTLENFKFIDTDFVIEKQQNLKISQIFSQFGEDYFRNLENNLIKQIVKQSNKIIATGGGIVENIQNLNLLLQHDTVFYLNTPLEIVKKRIKNDSNRPLLNQIDEKFKAREAKYKLAHYTIDAYNKDIGQICKEIIGKYYERNS
ncbi:MAG: hypothetical protein BHW64_05410 [Candidatus Melainabacteria bacterium LEY3_CP_29_8]|nr:MAG: hypothetical protein BHW64_05410 [Candidatus Melainabacteria bacterium LEY3_CP_29_8]